MDGLKRRKAAKSCAIVVASAVLASPFLYSELEVEPATMSRMTGEMKRNAAAGVATIAGLACLALAYREARKAEKKYERE